MNRAFKNVDINHLKVIKNINKGAKVDLIFCHGLATEPGMHYKIVKELSNVNHYDLGFPGHIDTDFKFTMKELNVDYFSKLLAIFIKQNPDLKNIILVGHSLGCAVIVFALKHLTKNEKERIKKIVLNAPLTINTLLTALHFTKYFTSDANKINDVGIEKFFKDLFYDPKKYLKEFNQWFDLDFYKKHQTEQKKLALTLLNPDMIRRIISAYHSEKKYENFTFITADKDRLVPFTMIRHYIKNFFKDAKHIEIKNGGHAFILEHKDTYIEILKEIIQNAKS
ncbi:alpha/beta fold hydrolase [Mycoplasma bradburyae]|uniref:Alpha/beta hydrolase n=1 Tax=Mycoplasma bradburyae TaxID=2963128 RepID=A0ABT5G9T1_9MOLU|nr:alpha/beta hydrolase [Mycoplasma bradburyae]MDC4181588.1 alpha/beta hydrolase [Mycoplasma bradburyae]UTS69989.1 alpha/beta hydrolase [Mycoplasma bradburyae]